MSDEAWDGRMNSYIEEAEKQIAGLNAEITRLRAEVEAFRDFTRAIRGLATSPDECEPNVSMRIAKLLAKHGVMDANGNILGDLLAARSPNDPTEAKR